MPSEHLSPQDPPERVAEALERDGCTRGAQALGYVDDLRDPLQALRGEHGGPGGFGGIEDVRRQLGRDPVS